MGRIQRFEDALKQALDKGWIEDLDDPWVDLDCYGTHKTHAFNCEECPMEDFCLDAKEERETSIIRSCE